MLEAIRRLKNELDALEKNPLAFTDVSADLQRKVEVLNETIGEVLEKLKMEKRKPSVYLQWKITKKLGEVEKQYDKIMKAVEVIKETIEELEEKRREVKPMKKPEPKQHLIENPVSLTTETSKPKEENKENKGKSSSALQTVALAAAALLIVIGAVLFIISL